MKILHILSQKELTGAEAYAIAIARRQVSEGHSVVFVSDTLTLALPVGATYRPMPIDRRQPLYRIRNFLSLRRLISEFKPDVVHAHSRAASWIARAVTFFGDTPLVSTVHGRQHWHTRFKANDVYGQRIITVCRNLRDHLTKDFGISAKKIDLVRNFVECDEYQETSPASERPFRIGLFGRTTGPKGEVLSMLLRDVFPRLMQEFPALEVLIGGGEIEQLKPRDRESFHAFMDAHPGRVEYFGRSPHLAAEFAKVDYVIGAGRIAVEGLYAGKKVFGFGEYQPVGWVTQSSFRSTIPSNYGDVGADREHSRWGDPEAIYSAIRAGLAGEIAFDFDRSLLAPFYDQREILRQIYSSYRQAIFKKRYPFGIPSLMFHKIVEGPFKSQHRTFIHIRRFERILRTLQILGKTPITFGDLDAAIQGKAPFPERPILLTFDDGYRSTLELAAPMLAKYRMKAIAYLLADKDLMSNEWDTREDPTEAEIPLLNRDERQRLRATGVFEIGSHGMRHRSLGELSAAARREEVFESKAALEAEFGVEILSYAYAYGNHSAEDSETVNRAGYHFGVGTDTHYGFEENIFRIFRANIFPEDGFFSIVKKSSPLYRFYFAAKRKYRNYRNSRRRFTTENPT